MNYKIAVMPGDGTGPEVVAEGLKVLRAAAARTGADEAAPPRANDILFWLWLAACGTLLLLAATNQISQDVAVVPMLWGVPLALYLLTFILCFHSERWYPRSVFGPLFLVAALTFTQFVPIAMQVPS